MSLKVVMTRAQTAVCTAVSPMSGSPTFDIDKKKIGGEFKIPPRPTGRRSNKSKCKYKIVFWGQHIQVCITSERNGSWDTTFE